jgi:uncharacterized membrane protein
MQAALESLQNALLDTDRHHKNLHFARSAAAFAAGYLSAAATGILILAALRGTIKFIIAVIARGVSGGLPSFVRLRIEMGSLVALSLQLLVAADVLETLTQVTQV